MGISFPPPLWGRPTNTDDIDPAILQLLEQMGFKPNIDGLYFNEQKRIWIRVFIGDTGSDIAERIFDAGSEFRKKSIKELLGG